MVTNCFESRNFTWPKRRLREASFFFPPLLGFAPEEGVEKYLFGSIPNVFQPSSQDVPEVPNVFLKRFAITPHFFSHIVWP